MTHLIKYLKSLSVLVIAIVIFNLLTTETKSQENFTSSQSQTVFDSSKVQFVGNFPFGPSYAVEYDSIRNILFVGSGGGVYIVDVSNPLDPQKLSENIHTRGVVKNIFYDYAEKHLYIAASSAGIEIWDVSDLANPYFINRFADDIYPVDVCITGVSYVKFVYVACASGLKIYSSSTSNPVLMGGLDTPGTPNKIFRSSHYVYIADGSDGGLRIIDVTNIFNPTETGFLNTYNAKSVFVLANYAYVADGTAGLKIIDISNPVSPIQVGFAPSEDIAMDVVVIDYDFGRYAFVADGGGLICYLVSNPSSPYKVGEKISTSNLASAICTSSSSYAFVSDWQGGVKIIDISYPYTLESLSNISTPGFARGVFVSGNYAYLSDGSNGLRLIDINDPQHPFEKSFYDTPGNAYKTIISGSILGKYAWIADGIAGLRILNVTNSLNPIEEGFYDTPGEALSVYLFGYAYIADASSGLRIINISNRTNPYEVGYYDTPGRAQGVFISGSYAYIADGFSGLRIINISNPAAPTETGFFDTNGYTQDVQVAGNYAYLAENYGGLRIINISNPSAPFEVGFYNPTGADYDGIFISGSYAYISDANAGLRIIEISSPTNPTLAGYYKTPGITFDVFVSDSSVYLACEETGLQIYTLPGITDVKNERSSAKTLPNELYLSQNYPNPFNPSTTISFSVPTTAFTTLKIFDELGREIAVLIDKELSAGDYSIEFNAKNLPSGVYIYSLKSGNFNDSKKLLLLK